MIIELKVRTKFIKLLEEKKESIFCNLGLDNSFRSDMKSTSDKRRNRQIVLCQN